MNCACGYLCNIMYTYLQRWDQVIVLQVRVKSQVFALKSESSLKSLRSSPSQVSSLCAQVRVKSQVFVLKSKSSLKSGWESSSQVQVLHFDKTSLKQVLMCFSTNVMTSINRIILNKFWWTKYWELSTAKYLVWKRLL